MSIFRSALRRILYAFLILLLVGMSTNTLIVLAPGFGTDERELDPSRGESFTAAAKMTRNNVSVLRAYMSLLAGLTSGDLGRSIAFGKPVAELLPERSGITFTLLAAGWSIGWFLGLGASATPYLFRHSFWQWPAEILCTFLLCLPAGLIGIVILLVKLPATLAISAVVFPKSYRYCRELFDSVGRGPYVRRARAEGISEIRILIFQIFPACRPQLIALMSSTLLVAMSACIPVEALCDVAGLGQLVWKSALSRDLYPLIGVTLVFTAFAAAVNTAGELVALSIDGRSV